MIPVNVVLFIFGISALFAAIAQLGRTFVPAYSVAGGRSIPKIATAFVGLFLCVNALPAVASGDISELSDKEVRALLIERLAEPEAAPEPVFNPAEIAYKIQLGFSKVHARANTLFGAYDQLSGLPGEWWKRINEQRNGSSFSVFLATFLICIAAGLVASALVKKRLNRMAVVDAENLSLATAFAGRLFRHGVGVVVLIIVATAGYFIFASGDERDRTLFFFFLSAVAIIDFIAGGSRALFEPNEPALRIPVMSDEDSRRFHLCVLTSTAFGAFGFFSCASFAALGINGDVHDLLLLIVGAGTTLLLSFTIWVQRDAITNDILAASKTPSVMRQLVGKFWPLMTFIAIPALFIGILINIFLGGLPLYGAALFTVFTLVLVPIAEAALSRAIEKLEGSEFTAATIVARVSRITLLLFVALSLAIVWRFNITTTVDSSVGSQIFQTLIQITATIAVAYAVWQILRVFLDQKIAAEDKTFAEENGITDMDDQEIGSGMSRTRTLLPLLRRAALIVLFTIVVLVSLSAMGVDTGPLLAGAGVIGLAIGFGSQTLVKDVVSGFFFLLEDAFRLGEYIDIGKAKGTVEGISVRSLKLRHHRGALNTVPFGSIDVIENFSRDWAIMKLKVRVPFETDLNMVRKLLKKVGHELAEVEAIRDDFLQPFKAQGAVEVDDYGFVISTKFMSKPGKQFVIRRYAFQAMQDAFEENDIPFARPRVRVVIDEVEADDLDAKAAAGGAVATMPKV
ncbi:MAG: mechanosensitive ion channel domain-containing protein [Paracoccaceae bacterium]